MAQPGGGEGQVVSQFPLPPRQLYSRLGQEDVPLPAPPPAPGQDFAYGMFGVTYTTSERLPSLEESGRACLYDSSKPASEELQRLNERLLRLFHVLLITLSTPGAQHQHVVSRIEDTFINMHHLLNTLRPAQAVRDLRLLLERQCTGRRDAASSLRAAEASARATIADAARGLAPPTADSPETAAQVAKAAAVVDEHVAREAAAAAQPAKNPARSDAPSPLGWYDGDDASVAASLRAHAVPPKTSGGAPRPPPFTDDVLAKIDALVNDPSL